MSALLAIQDLRSFTASARRCMVSAFPWRAVSRSQLIGRNGMGKTTLLRSIRRPAGRTAGARSPSPAQAPRGLKPEEIAPPRHGLCAGGAGRLRLAVRRRESRDWRQGQGVAGSRRWTSIACSRSFRACISGAPTADTAFGRRAADALDRPRADDQPDLILLDEATEGLAPLVAQEIWKTLGIIRSEGIATIVVDKDHRSLARRWRTACG